MVKASTIRWVLTASGLTIMMLILLSKSSTTAKGIGMILSILLVTMGIIITGPLKKHFEITREGNIRPDDSYMDFR